MTILLYNLVLYAGIGCLEWYLALRRTLACARGEKATLVSLVFAENLLGLFVLVNFIKESDWFIAIVYSVGAALGALLVSEKEKEFQRKDSRESDAARLPAPPPAEPLVIRKIVICRPSPPIPAWRRGEDAPPPLPYRDGSLILDGDAPDGMIPLLPAPEAERGKAFTPLP